MNPNEELFYGSETNFLLVGRNIFAAPDLRELRNLYRESLANALTLDLDPSTLGRIQLGVAPDAVRLRSEWNEIWKKADLSKMWKVVPRFTQVTFPPMLRTLKTRQGEVPWHQDEAYMISLGKRGHREIITCFVPLDDDPHNHPSLEFSLNPTQEAIPHVERDGFSANRFDLAESVKVGLSPPIRFDLDLGDCLIFGKHVLHRTSFRPFAARTSIEFRLTTLDARIAGKDYFDLKSMRFYKNEEQTGHAKI